MCDEQLLNGHALFGRRRFQQWQIAARIGKGALHRFGAPNEAAILLQWRHGDDGGLKRWFAGHNRVFAFASRTSPADFDSWGHPAH